MQQRTRNTNNTRPCPGPIGPAAPHATLIESRIVQIATQNRSTDPKKSGAKTSTAIVTQRWGNRPAAGCGYLKILGAALQADGETRSVVTASSIRRRSAAWTILLDWTYRSRRQASVLWTTRAGSCGK